MNRKELIELHEKLCSQARELMAKKNHDYSGAQDTEDAFQNFRFIEATGATTAEVGIFTRLCDKVKRLGGVVARGDRLQVSDESFEDTIIDLINYAVILNGYRLSKGNEVRRNSLVPVITEKAFSPHRMTKAQLEDYIKQGVPFQCPACKIALPKPIIFDDIQKQYISCYNGHQSNILDIIPVP